MQLEYLEPAKLRRWRPYFPSVCHQQKAGHLASRARQKELKQYGITHEQAAILFNIHALRNNAHQYITVATPTASHDFQRSEGNGAQGVSEEGQGLEQEEPNKNYPNRKGTTSLLSSIQKRDYP